MATSTMIQAGRRMTTYYCELCDRDGWSQPLEHDICDACWDAMFAKGICPLCGLPALADESGGCPACGQQAV